MLTRLLAQFFGGDRSPTPESANAPDSATESPWRAAQAQISLGDVGEALSALLPVLAGAPLEFGQRRLIAAALDALAAACNTSETARIDAAYLLGCAFLEHEEFEAAHLCARIVAADPEGRLVYQLLPIGDGLPAACRAAGQPAAVSSKLFSVAAQGPDVPAYVCTLPGGKVLGHSGIPVSAGNIAYPHRHIHNIASTFNRERQYRGEMVCLASATHLLVCEAGVDDYPGTHVLIGNNQNPGHWFLNHFGRLRVLEELAPGSDTKLLVFDNIKPLALRSLELAGFPLHRLTLLPKGRTARIERLLVPSMLFGGIKGLLYWCDEIPHLIRRTIAPPRKHPGSRRILVSRKGARWRRLQNEDALLDTLADLGFESVDPGKLSLDEQVSLAAESEVMVGAFGAGMSIVLLCHPGTAMVEIKTSLNGVMDVHPLAAAPLGVTYKSVLATPVATAEEPAGSLDADMVCDPALVRAVVLEAMREATAARSRYA